MAIMTLGGGDFRRRRRGRGGLISLGGDLVRRGLSVSPAVLFTVITALCAGIWVIVSLLPPRTTKTDTAPGLALLETLEQGDPAAVDAVLRERAPQVPELDLDENGEIDAEKVWSAFQDYVLLGDSRGVGFDYYGFLDDLRVMADAGNTILQIEEHMEEIVALQPRYVYICYGINDVGLGIWSPDEYAEAFMGYVAELKSRLPEVTVVISSILPAYDPAFEQNSAWYDIPTFNEKVAAACEENGIAYSNNDALAAAYPELYQPDGIHLMPEFYPYWAKNLIEAGLKAQNNDAVTDAAFEPSPDGDAGEGGAEA